MPKRAAKARPLGLVTTNPGKVREFRAALRGVSIDLHHVRRPYHELQADTLEEVASFGLQDMAGEVEGDFFLEDSGLFVSGLRGFPGVYSAWAFKSVGVDGILRLLKGAEDRRATFASVVALSWRGETHLFRGECHGRIASGAHGHGGFGFDPIFVPVGERRTFAEMSLEEKLSHSHRGRAAQKLRAFLEHDAGGAPLRA